MNQIAPQVLQMARAAQSRAIDPQASVWVAASAGSGKTKVLTDRVLSLMLNGTAPARILCLTFTKAAAAEMRNRLAGHLADWASMSSEDLTDILRLLLGEAPDAAKVSRARQLFALVLDAPGGMKIQTVHAFCQALLGRFPLEAGVAPHFKVLDERSAQEMLSLAQEEVLASAQDDDSVALADALAEITPHIQEQSFAELMAQLIAERGRLGRWLRDHDGTDGMEAEIYRILGAGRNDSAAALRAAAGVEDNFNGPALRRAVVAMLQGSKTDQAHATLMASWLDNPEQRSQLFDAYLRAYFKDSGEGDVFVTLIHKDALAAARGADEVLAAEAKRLALVRARLRALTVARATVALLRLGAAILDTYQRHKEARAVLDYDDLILAARDLLQRPTVASWVLYKLDGGLDHVLIDEAQDTNPEQWQVIAALTEEFFSGEGTRGDPRENPRTVFAVGDAKQSIYSFQRADPLAFERMRKLFAERSQAIGQLWNAVDLEVSFRSTAPVLAAVDAVFARDPARDGVLFDETLVKHVPARIGQAGVVEVWPACEAVKQETPAPWQAPLDRQGSPPARTRLARLLAQRIWHWTVAAEGADDPEAWLASKGRRLQPGDVLILVRRRNALVEELVRELKQRAVPVTGIDRMVLTDQLAVMDLVALGRVLLLPEDDLTLATVLKGPLLGLDEDQLFKLAYKREGSLWQALMRHAGDDPTFKIAADYLRELAAHTDFVPPYTLFAQVLNHKQHGRARLVACLGSEANDPIDEFLSLALAYEREHAPSLEGFLHWLEAGSQEIKRDTEHGGNAVRIMTVHGAKGLQAPVVFLPDTMQGPPPKRGVFWLDGDQGPALWPLRQRYDGAAAQAARESARLAGDREYRRLLYVAMTRAEDRLYLCGWQTRKTAPEDCWYNLVDRAMADIGEAVTFDFTKESKDAWQGTGWRLASPQAPEITRAAESVAAVSRQATQVLPAWAQSPPPPEPAPPQPLAPSRPSAAEPVVRSPLGDDDGNRFQRGRLIHRLLQSLPDLAPEQREAAAKRFLARSLHGLTPAEQDNIRRETLAVLDHPAFTDLFSPIGLAEVPIVGMVGSKTKPVVIAGQVDRLVVTEDAVSIIDFKTNRQPPEDTAGVSRVYLKQMAAYRAVLADIYPDRPISCFLLWTDGPRLIQLKDEMLTLHAS